MDMKMKFEIIYTQENHGDTQFIVFTLAKDEHDAYKIATSNGYKPIRIKQAGYRVCN